jgi:hypothetical protein
MDRFLSRNKDNPSSFSFLCPDNYSLNCQTEMTLTLVDLLTEMDTEKAISKVNLRAGQSGADRHAARESSGARARGWRSRAPDPGKRASIHRPFPRTPAPPRLLR